MGEGGRQVAWRDGEQVGRGMRGHHEPGRGDENELADPRRPSQREFGRDPAAERKAHEVDDGQRQSIEQLGIMQGEVLDPGQERVVARLAEARMIGDEDPMGRGERLQGLEAGERARPVQEDERRPAADRVDHSLDAGDIEGSTGETVHRDIGCGRHRRSPPQV